MMKKKKNNNRLILGLLALLVIVILVFFYTKTSKPKGLDVFTEKVQQTTIQETVGASGRIFPVKEIKISSDVSGEIVELYVEEGDSVKQGQLLAKIDPDAYKSAVERGEATVNSSKAQHSNSKAQIERTIAQIEQIKAQLENQIMIHQRNIKLHSEGVISDADFENSEAQIRNIKANLKSAEASKRAAEESAKAAQFNVKSTQASLRELKTNLNRTSIYAPMGGIVSKLNVEQGERVVGTRQMTGTEMMRISNLNNMEVWVDVSESDILNVNIDDKAEIDVDAFLDRKFIGHVTEIASSSKNIGTNMSLNTDQVTNFIVKINIDKDSYTDLVNEGNKYPFKPGLSASVDILTEVHENVMSVPLQSVTVRAKNEEKKKEKLKNKEDISDELLEVVFVVKADSTFMVEVKTGIQDNERIEIISGLSGDEEVVSGPYAAISRKLKDKKRVNLVTEKEYYKKSKKNKD